MRHLKIKCLPLTGRSYLSSVALLLASHLQTVKWSYILVTVPMTYDLMTFLRVYKMFQQLLAFHLGGVTASRL
jgi:hypothetical protein